MAASTRFARLTEGAEPVITDGGIETRIMFETDYPMDPRLQVAAMVSDHAGRPLIRAVYESYVDAVAPSGLPLVIGTPTFRASANFTHAAGRPEPGVVAGLNQAAAAMHAEIRASAPIEVLVAGVLGPARDAYTPADAYDAEHAHRYHREQAEALAGAGVDLLFAATFPAVAEAIGVGRAMAATGLPFVVSLVLDRAGRVLDGAPLAVAVERIDAEVEPRPAYLSLSCIHPSVAALALGQQSTGGRVRECKANGSPLPTGELVELDHPEADAPDRFADQMWNLRERFGLNVLGGCCGTDQRHIRALADRAAAPSPA